MNKKSVKVLFTICLCIYLAKLFYTPLDRQEDTRIFNEEIFAAYQAKQSGVQVLGKGKVKLMLPDDTKGSEHQRIVVQISDDHTVLIAHNIDLAPRVSTNPSETILFYGEYEYNDKGGVVHWTHYDPKGKHEDGWIEARSKIYQKY